MTSPLKFSKLISRLIMIFFILIAIYSLSIFIAYLIPNEWIIENWTESVNVINSEIKRWPVMTGINGTKLDTFTDNLIFQKLTNSDDLSALVAGVWNNGYYRYWMGDIPILRFLLIFMNYVGIRYLNLFLIFSLMLVVYRELSRKVSNIYAFLFFFTMTLIHFWIFPLSIQYTPVYVILMLAILAIIKADDWQKLTLPNVIVGSFIVGSLTNYFDLLTTPILTFGLPFLIWYIIKYLHQKPKFGQTVGETISISISWILGYALTWFAKWLITSIILKENIFRPVLNQILLRTGGSETEVLNFPTILSRLLQTMFPNYAILLLAILVLIWFVLFLKWHKPFQLMLHQATILLVGCLPFIWYFILQNHNQHHYYFTYRNLAITVLAGLTYLYMSIDWQSLIKRGQTLKHAKHRKDH